MSKDQLSHFSLSAINALTYVQRSSLDNEQIEAIQGTVKTFGSVLNKSNFTHKMTWWMIAICLKFLMLNIS